MGEEGTGLFAPMVPPLEILIYYHTLFYLIHTQLIYIPFVNLISRDCKTGGYLERGLDD